MGVMQPLVLEVDGVLGLQLQPEVRPGEGKGSRARAALKPLPQGLPLSWRTQAPQALIPLALLDLSLCYLNIMYKKVKETKFTAVLSL